MLSEPETTVTHRLGPFSVSAQCGAMFVPAIPVPRLFAEQDRERFRFGDAVVSRQEMEELADAIDASGLEYLDLVKGNPS